MRRHSHKQPKDDAANEHVGFVELLLHLMPLAAPEAKRLFRNCCVWLRFVPDASPMFDAAISDALTVAPVPMGEKRARRLDIHCMKAVGRVVGEGIGGRTAGNLTKTLARFRKWAGKSLHTSSAERAWKRRFPKKHTQLATGILPSNRKYVSH